VVRGELSFRARGIGQIYPDWMQKSPTLDLVNDCFRFVTGFFDVISTSAPHIYHSALLLSPQTSIVRGLYESRARPLARVVQGVPASWDLSIVKTSFPDPICAAAWSPCGRFIAIARPSSSEIAIMDAVTLEQLYTMRSTSRVHSSKNLTFSPDGRLLTCHWCTSYSANYFVNWDLQTGGLISDISIPRDFWSYHSMSYSGCGTMFGVLFKGSDAPTILTYNVLSGTRMSSHSVKNSVADTIWTHGKCLRFATVEAGSITIWEVGFTSRHAPTEVDSLPTPDDFPSTRFLLLPTLSRLAFVLQGRVLVWDARHSKMLLDSVDVKNPRNISFSPDGRFVVCGTEGPEFYLWKESPDGYLLHQNFVSSAGPTKQVVSPNGESIIAFGGPMVQRWRTTNSRASLSSVSTRPSQRVLEDFILEFSPDRTLAMFARRWDNTATVLDPTPDAPLQIINVANVGMGVCGLGVGNNLVVVVGYGKIAILGLQSHAYDTTVEYPVPVTKFGHSELRLYASVSSLLHRIAVKGAGCMGENLCIYDTRTGKLLTVVESKGQMVGFNPPGWGSKRREDNVWCVTASGDVEEWEISGWDSIVPQPVEPQGVLPWQSSCDYQVTDDGWVIGSGKRLLWLPHHWRSGWMTRKWSVNFLALLHGELPAPIILDLKV
jgi:WD40 repeat protein